MKLLRMLLTVLGIAAMVLALAGGIGFPVWAEEAMSDDAKRAAIEAMYRNY
jgi:hypothetical protein